MKQIIQLAWKILRTGKRKTFLTVLSIFLAFFLICSGGISLRALDGTLSCRHYPGLYVTGEAAHVDGPCGGYNLQWAWSSGHLAGLAAAGEM